MLVLLQSKNPASVAHFPLRELHDFLWKIRGTMGQNQQWQTKGTSCETVTNGLRMAISQYVTVPKFCKDISKVCNRWDKLLAHPESTAAGQEQKT